MEDKMNLTLLMMALLYFSIVKDKRAKQYNDSLLKIIMYASGVHSKSSPEEEFEELINLKMKNQEKSPEERAVSFLNELQHTI